MDIPEGLEISISDIRRRGHCARMAHFFRSNGLRDEYARMLKGGSIDAALLAETEDPRAIDVIAHKIANLSGEG